MMSIIHRERHFISDCDRALKRLLKDQEANRKLIIKTKNPFFTFYLQGEPDHLVYSRDSVQRSIDLWEQRHKEATHDFERGLDFWFNWLQFYWREYEGIKRGFLF